MTLTESLEISNFVRRSSYGNEEYYLDYSDIYYTRCWDGNRLNLATPLTKDDLMANDWVALEEIKQSKTLSTNNKVFRIVENPV